MSLLLRKKGNGPMTWDQEETRRLIAELFGNEQLELAKPALRSVDDRMLYAQFHYQDAKRAFSDLYEEAKLNDVPLLVALHRTDEDWGKFNVAIRRIGAYLTACIQSIHSLADILAHAILFSLALNRDHTEQQLRKFSSGKVVSELRKNPIYISLSDGLASMIQHDHFKHLSALANMAKHQSIVFPSLTENWSNPNVPRHFLKFSSFRHDSNTYPEVVANDFLSAEFERCNMLAVETGCELNKALSNMLH